MAHGPIRGLRFIHAAIRAQAAEIQTRCAAMTEPAQAAGVTDAVAMLARATRAHAQGEDEGYFPTLAERCEAGTVEPFQADHVDENGRLDQLEQLASACTSHEELGRLAQVASEVREHLGAHMTREEELLWPLTEEKFSPPEQGAIMGAIMQAVPREHLPRLIPWMTEMQSPEDAVVYVQLLQKLQPPEVFSMSAGWIREGVSPDRLTVLKAKVEGL